MGATAIIPVGILILALESNQPPNNVSGRAIGTANFPATSIMLNPSDKLAPAPPNSSGTHADVRPDSSRAFHKSCFHESSLAALIFCGSHRSSNILVVASISRLSSDIKFTHFFDFKAGEYSSIFINAITMVISL